MLTNPQGGLNRPHDWHSNEYVSEWIAHDEAREPVRFGRLHEMLAAAPFPRESPIAVLDVGAGYGAVTEELLKVYPAARVTLQDYSEPMLAEAKKRLAARAGQLRYVTCDLTDPAWAGQVGGPFDLAMSAIALHNLRDNAQIFACYRAICGLLKPGGWFIEEDLFFNDGLAAHMSAMQAGGFAAVECRWQDERRAIVAAHRA
jgi:ubiquinone/menaquinone biosynthesis C-methylase UbiE